MNIFMSTKLKLSQPSSFTKLVKIKISVFGITLILGGCMGVQNASPIKQCQYSLDRALKDYTDAWAETPRGTVSWREVSALLTEAGQHKAAGNYPACLKKVALATRLIDQKSVGRDVNLKSSN